MKKVLFLSVAVFLLTFLASHSCDIAYAQEPSSSEIRIDNEYVIPDRFGKSTYYVVVATNNTGMDISISADFTALDKSGEVLYKVNDYFDAVKKDQQFIIYGQFLNDKIKGAKNYTYEITVNGTDNCKYSAIDLSTSESGQLVEVSATNYSEYDVDWVGVRMVFFRNGRAVAFDTVNIADEGYTFHGGSTNSQLVGYNAGSYDDYLVTYTCAKCMN